MCLKKNDKKTKWPVRTFGWYIYLSYFVLTAILLNQGYRYHKLNTTFSKFYSVILN